MFVELNPWDLSQHDSVVFTVHVSSDLSRNYTLADGYDNKCVNYNLTHKPLCFSFTENISF